MMATSIQSSAFATTEGEYESSSEEVVLDLSMEYMKEAIKESIEYGIHYSGDMAFSDAEGKASKYEEFLSGENVFELVSIPYADTVLYDAMPDDTSLRIFVRADEGQLKEMEQKASEAELKATDDALFAPEYEILGSEEIIFLFTNGSDVDYSFKLNVDGHFTPAIKVPSGETLGYEVASESEAEEETEEETTAEETTAAEETAEGVGPSGETGGTVTDDGAGFGGGSGSGSGSDSGSSEIVDDADNQTDGTTTTDDSNKNDGTGSEEGSSEGSVTAPEEGNGSSEEVNSGSDTSDEQGSAEGGQTDNSTTNSDDQTSEGTDGSGSVSDNGAASDNGASSDNGTASDNGTSSEKKEEVKETKVEIVRPKKNNDSESAKSDDSGSKSSSDDKGSSDSGNDSADSDDGEQSASIVSYNIPRVTATMDGTEETNVHVGPNTSNDGGYVDDNTDWDDWFSADDDEDEYYSEDSSNVADSSSVVKSGTILEPVFVKTESQAKGFARFALFAAPASSTTQTAVVYANTIMSLEESGNVFVPKVDLYDYYDVNNGSYDTANDSRGFNGQVPSGGFLLYAKGTRDNRGKWNQTGLYQGLAVSSYENADTQRPGLTKSLGNHTTLFPNTDEYIKTNAVGKKKDSAFNNGIRWYPNVDFPFFTEDSSDGYTRYSFDSNNTKIRRTDDNNNLNLTQISNGTSGFWPFNTAENLTNTTKEYAFGMHMSIPFYLPANGCFDAEGTAPLVFNFRGDDDVWVYLKDEKTQKADLILDIGGIHGATEGSVNFKTKTSTVSGGNGISFDFEGGREYTLEFFFIERNPVESNCKIEIGLPVIPNSGITIGKQVQGKEELIPKDVTYNFVIYSSNDLEALKNAYSGNVDTTKVNVITSIQSLNAGKTGHAEFPSGDQYFFVKEVDNKKAETTWTVSGGAKEVPGTEELVPSGACTKIYTIPEASEIGVLMYCTNTFGKLAPTINKSAWLLDKDSSLYDLALEVTGDTTTIIGESTSTAKDILFVLDRSGSMDDNGGWKALTNALDSVLTDLSTQEDVKVNMFAFSDNTNTELGWKDSTDLDTIKKYYSNIDPSGNTNPAKALMKAKQVLNASERDVPKFLIFITDGAPAARKQDYTFSWALTAQTEGEKLRDTSDGGYTKDELGIYMIGVGSGVTHTWWMNPAEYEYFKQNNDNDSSYSWVTKDGYEELSESEKATYTKTTKTTYPNAYIYGNISDLNTILGEVVSELQTPDYVKNIVVNDTLSAAVEPYSTTSGRVMDIWLCKEKVVKDDAADNEGTLDLSSYKSTLLTEQPVTDESGQVVLNQYKYMDGTTEVATYNTETKVLRWAVASSLSATETRTLIYSVHAVEPGNESGLELTDADKDSITGTHYYDGEKGYHSNVEATISYEGGMKEFDHPVVKPEGNGNLIITKKLDDESASNEEFDFTVELSRIPEQATIKYFVNNGTEQTVTRSETGRATVMFKLAPGQSCVFTGLNKNVGYEVTESQKAESYASSYQLVKTEKEVDEEEPVVNEITEGVAAISNTVSGEMNYNKSTGNTVWGYSVLTNISDNATTEAGAEKGTWQKADKPEGKENVVWVKDGEFFNWDELTKKVSDGEEHEYTRKEKIADYWVDVPQKDGVTYSSIEEMKAVCKDEVIGEPQENGTKVEINVKINRKEAVSEGWIIKTYYIYVGEQRCQTPEDIINAYKSYYGVELSKDDINYSTNFWGEECFAKDSYVIEKEYTKTFQKPTTYYWVLDGNEDSEYYSGMTADEVKADLELKGAVATMKSEESVSYYGTRNVRKTYGELKEDYELREYSSQGETKNVVAKEIEITFTNKINPIPHARLTITKAVNGQEGMLPANPETYEFVIYKKDGTIFTNYGIVTDSGLGELTNVQVGTDYVKGFTISGSGSITIEFKDKDIANSEFKIIEITSGTAVDTRWNDTNSFGTAKEFVISDANDIQQTLTCTNYYYDNTLTISKTLSDYSYASASDAAKKFTYEVEFIGMKGNTSVVGYSAASSSEVEFEDGVLNRTDNTIQLEDNKFEVTIAAGGILKLERIPAGVQYKVTEKSFADTEADKYYDYEVTKVTHNGVEKAPIPSDGVVSGIFKDISDADDRNQSVAYENKLIPVMSQITVTKEIVYKDVNYVNSGAGEEFIFKITNNDPHSISYGQSIYVSLTVEKDSSGQVTASKTVGVPYGENYVVTEEKHMRYQQRVTNQTNVAKTISGQDHVTLQNYKVKDGYFSDVSTKVNTVNEDGQGSGFPLKNDRKYNSQNALQKVVAWLGSDNKENGDE